MTRPAASSTRTAYGVMQARMSRMKPCDDDYAAAASRLI
jgi:hypothetical protein